jgi:hypothetical protein
VPGVTVTVFAPALQLATFAQRWVTSLTLVNGDLGEYQIQQNAGSVVATSTQQSSTWFAQVAAFRATTMSQNSISGTITPASSGTGATIHLERAREFHDHGDASGNYVFSGLANGSYVVTPTKAGYSFTPPSQNVVVSDASQPGINFTAQSTTSTYTISGNISPAAGGNGATVSLFWRGNWQRLRRSEWQLQLYATEKRHIHRHACEERLHLYATFSNGEREWRGRQQC